MLCFSQGSRHTCSKRSSSLLGVKVGNSSLQCYVAAKPHTAHHATCRGPPVVAAAGACSIRSYTACYINITMLPITPCYMTCSSSCCSSLVLQCWQSWLEIWLHAAH